jgi:sugar transferase (PEP-CTERM/EpsH1 system associated)
LEKGDKLRLYHQIRYLSRTHEIILVSLAEQPFDKNLVKLMQEFCQEIYVIPHSTWNNYLHALLGLFRGLPVNIGYFVNNATRKKIHAIIEKTRPDGIYVQLVRMAPYVAGQNVAEMSIDLMDAFSLRLQRRSKQTGLLMAQLWRIEEKLISRQERRWAKSFDNRFIISDTDRNFLHDQGIRESIDLLRNGVDTQFFKPIEVEKKYHVVFVGNMSYHPNILAAQYLVTEIAPLLRESKPNLRILIAGANPTNAVWRLAGDGVEVSGYVADIRDAYASASIFVAPIFVGSGVQNKILEAMAMEIPCITSPQVIEAIGGIDNLVLQASNPEEYQSMIEKLLSDPEERINMGRKSRQYIKEYLSWEHCCKPLDKLNRA